MSDIRPAAVVLGLMTLLEFYNVLTENTAAKRTTHFVVGLIIVYAFYALIWN